MDLEIWWGFQFRYCNIPHITQWITKCQFSCLWTDLNKTNSLTWKFDGDSKCDIVVYLKWLAEPQKSNFLVYWPIWIFSPFNWKFIRASKLDIEVYLKWLSEPQSQIFLFMDQFQPILFLSTENSLEIPNPNHSTHQMSVWTTKA